MTASEAPGGPRQGHNTTRSDMVSARTVGGGQSSQNLQPRPDGVFVIGSPRSGTSALAWALAAHPDFATGPEADFVYYLARSNAVPDAWSASVVRDDGLLASRGVSLESFLAAMGHGVSSVFALTHGPGRWIDSSPANTMVADRIAAMLPDAKFLHILRDGRAAVASMTKSGFDTLVAKDFDAACSVWVSYVNAASSLGSTFRGRVFTIRQEAMAEDPEGVMNETLAFLEASPDPGPASKLREGRINSSYGNSGSPADYRRAKPASDMPSHPWTDWSDAQWEAFCSIAGETMVAHGYPCDRDAPLVTHKGGTRMATVEAPDTIAFACNICGQRGSRRREEFGREVPTCTRCRSTSRMRCIVHLLTSELLGTDTPLPDLAPARHLKGLGLSDWHEYAARLADTFEYTNTFFDHEPRLDITAPPDDWADSFDFIVSSDVFEHVVPPASRAFEGALRLLKPGGLFVFSVPYSLESENIEHFPELHDFRITSDKVLINTTRDGREQRFNDLVFHGGDGATLEMRVFCKSGVERALHDAGFTDVSFFEGEHASSGVVFQEHWSRPLIARKPS